MTLRLGLFFLLASVAGSSPSAAADANPTSGRHPSLPQSGTLEGLGTNIHFTKPQSGEMEMLARGGFRWIRMDFTWGATERRRGEYNFSAYEQLLDALEPHGIRALFILDYSNQLYESNRSVSTPEGRAAYARWAAAAARHFQGRGILWEIWNEPNIAGFWKPEPNPNDYTAMALAACKAIRHAAPQEAVIGPATSLIDLEFIEECFQAGLLNWWDAVSVHPYRQSDPETVIPEYFKLRELIQKYAPAGKEIPILSAEWGYSSAWKNFNPEKQGRMLPRQWLINLSQGIAISIWYDWHDDGRDPEEPEHHFGTVMHRHHVGREPVYDAKPAYLAARTLTGVLRGSKFIKRIAVERPDDYVLLFGDDQKCVLAAWTTSAVEHTVRIPSDPGEFAAISYLGQDRTSITSPGDALEIGVSQSPVYLTTASRNARLEAATEARPMAVQLIPGPGKMLKAKMQRLGAFNLRGTVELMDLQGLDAVESHQPFELSEDEPFHEVGFRLRAQPTEECQLGLRLLDQTGQMVHSIPVQRLRYLDEAPLKSCRIIADGDAKVAAKLRVNRAAPPQPLGDLSGDVVQVHYEFDRGWRFLCLVPSAGANRQIPGKPTGFGLWVFGDGKGGGPRLRVRDTTGQTWQPSGPTIDWKGWRYVEFPLNTACGHWGGKEDGIIHFPITWDSVFLLDNVSRQPLAGTVYVAQPVALYDRYE
jgi:hypothetical protein